MAVAPVWGRYWCGNYCPRGSFYEQIVAKISPQRKIPLLFRRPVFRLLILSVIMVVFTWQIYTVWGNLSAVGFVFVRMILVTTLIGIVLGLLYNQRAWCSFCPMGTVAAWISRSRSSRPLQVADNCISCKRCTDACPLELAPYQARGIVEGFNHPDCLKCGRCVERCPRKALKFKAVRSFKADKIKTI